MGGWHGCVRRSQHFRWQVLGFYHLRRRHNGQPMTDVFQLAHIAGERKQPQPRQRGVGDAFWLDAQLDGADGQEVAREHGHVFAPFAQCRQTQADHVQAVEQVFPERALAHALLQVLVGGGDHTHIGLDGGMPAHAVEVSVAEHPQQPGLQVERHVADFVQEQGAAVGLLKTAPAHGLRARECAAFVAEQLTLEQVFRDRGRIDGHERPVVACAAARRVFVQRTCHQFLAGTRFPRDHYGHVALAQAANGPKYILHGRGLPEHFGRAFDMLLKHLFALALLHRAANQFNRFRQIERLGKVFESSALECGHRAVQVGEGGHDDDRQAWVFFLDLFQQVQPRATRHADVAHQYLRPVLVSRGGQSGQHVTRIREAARGQVLAQQRLFKDETDGLVIVYDPDRLHVCRYLSDRQVKLQGSGISILKSVRPGTLSTSIIP